jgi:hypothetical protein
MGFYAYLLLCVLAGLFLVQAQLLPSSILCASSHNATITRDDCKRWIMDAWNLTPFMPMELRN